MEGSERLHGTRYARLLVVVPVVLPAVIVVQHTVQTKASKLELQKSTIQYNPHYPSGAPVAACTPRRSSPR